jgi:hypothetical protein
MIESRAFHFSFDQPTEVRIEIIEIIETASWSGVSASTTVARGSPGKVYVVLNNHRHWIPDKATFEAMGIRLRPECLKEIT